jgi:class 3 adenylate cyclase
MTMRPYNVQILRLYISYLKNQLKWEDSLVAAFLAKINIGNAFLEDDQNWFDQPLADQFYYQLVEETKDTALAFNVGVYLAGESTSGLSGRIIRGLLSPSIVFGQIASIGSTYSKGASYLPVKVSSESAVIRCRPVDGCEEKEYQCQNRMGMLASIPKIFGSEKSAILHPLCFHRGDQYCEYVVSWNKSFKPLQLLALVTIVLGLIGAGVFLIGPNRTSWLGTYALCLTGFVLIRELIIAKRLRSSREQNNTLIDSAKLLNRRHDDALLIKRMSRSFAQSLNAPDLAKLVVNSIKSEMRVDRSCLWMIDNERGVLSVLGAAGYPKGLEELILGLEHPLASRSDANYLVSVATTKSWLFMPRVSEQFSSQTLRSQKLLKILEAESLIVVPVVYEDRVLGVLSVEIVTPERTLSSMDLDLLSSIADSLGVSLTNTETIQKLAESLQAERAGLEEQNRLREFFRKYVPSIVQSSMRRGDSTDLELRKEELSVMFIDIFGFSRLAEILDSESLADVLNEYIGVMSSVIAKNGGELNKIIGDGILAFFDPQRQNSVKTAQKIISSMTSLNSALFAKGYPKIDIGIGIHKGIVTIGNIGCANRLDFTLIGDAVNTAARLEKHTRAVGPNSICFSSSLTDEAAGVQYQAGGNLKLKGKDNEVSVFVIPHTPTFSIHRAT